MSLKIHLARYWRIFVLAYAGTACAAAHATTGVSPVSAAFCEAAWAYAEERDGVSFLVLKEGETVCEAYAPGVDGTSGFELWSGTKSFNGIMAAVAVEDGLLTLDEPAADTIDEWKGDPLKEDITVRHLLSLTSGLASRVGRAPSYGQAIRAEMSASPGERFIYGATSFQAFGELMSRKLAAAGLDEDPLDYLERRILRPAGVEWTAWRRSEDGDPLLPQGASMTAREWGEYGEFIRKGAEVDGQMLVDPVAFDEMFVGSAANPAYGLGWWMAKESSSPDIVTASLDLRHHADEFPDDLVIAAGAGNQRLYIIPSLGLTIVRQTDFQPRRGQRQGKWSDTDFLTIILSGLENEGTAAVSQQ